MKKVKRAKKARYVSKEYSTYHGKVHNPDICRKPKIYIGGGAPLCSVCGGHILLGNPVLNVQEAKRQLSTEKLKGKIIVIEGTDGSGKQTQAAMLKEKLCALGCSVYSTSFPRYDSDSSAPVRMYLGGEISKNPQDVSAKAASAFYAVDRYITYKREIEPVVKHNNSVIVFDRWVESNLIHQGAKLIAGITDKTEREEKLKEFSKWLYELEYTDMGVPKPDITIYLYVPTDYTIKLKESRPNKITGGEKQDIHESDYSHLLNASEAGMIASKLFNWKVIKCVKNGKMRTIEDIANEIWLRITSDN